MRSTQRGASGAASISPTATGVSITPDFKGLYPRMNWKYCVSRNVEANSAKYVIVIVADAAEKRGLRKNFTSSIGRGVYASHAANAARNSAPTTMPMTTLG